MVTVAATETVHSIEVTIVVEDSAAEVAVWGGEMEAFGATCFRIRKEVAVTPPESQCRIVASSATGSGIKAPRTAELLGMELHLPPMEYSKVLQKLGVDPQL